MGTNKGPILCCSFFSVNSLPVNCLARQTAKEVSKVIKKINHGRVDGVNQDQLLYESEEMLAEIFIQLEFIAKDPSAEKRFRIYADQEMN